MHRFAFRLTLAAISAVAVGAWYHQGNEAKAAQDPIEAPVQMELSGLAVPGVSAQDQAQISNLLSPSCDSGVAGACERLAAICTDLQGAMTDNQDGTQTCLIALD